MPRVWEVPVHDSTRVHDARVAAEAAAARAGLDEYRTAGVALVATELATNLLKHAGGGQVLVDAVPPSEPTGSGWQGAGHRGAGVPGGLVAGSGTLGGGSGADTGSELMVQITAIDHGPGIADVTAALRDGYSTADSLGTGLGACVRMADEFDLRSVPGRGTVAVARIGARPRRRGVRGPVLPVRAGGVNVAFGGAEFSGDAWGWVRSGERMTLLMADGLGHGAAAAHASDAAVDELRRSAHASPADLLRLLNGALRGTRGAAVAAAQFDAATRRLSFCGVGNIGARLRSDGRWRALLSRPGVVGVHQPRTLREEHAEWGPGDLLILHTDGLPSRWTPPVDPGLTRFDPAVIAASTVRDASSSALPVRDDTAVAVLTSTEPDRTP